VPALTTICAGVDLGGTKILAVVGDRAGRVLAEAKIDTLPAAGPAAAFERVVQVLNRIAQPTQTEMCAIGVGVPGLVDPEKGIIEFLPNLPKQWSGFPAAEFLKQRTGKPAFLLNDARLAALGEYSFGTGRASSDLLVVTVARALAAAWFSMAVCAWDCAAQQEKLATPRFSRTARFAVVAAGDAWRLWSAVRR